MFTNVKIEDEDNWWYNSCNIFHDKAEKIEKNFNCVDCKRNFPYCEKRFRVFILADDNTFACNVILMDRVVKRIVHTTTINLLNETKKNLEVIQLFDTPNSSNFVAKKIKKEP
ncbi:uncharacterized protein LOC141719781 [Apium graveolens]|uniref:uncharacterized protein LOC141719781 n=1 Tax=Apium graveolens TaxID=4045 RepID=UPI003D7B53F2